MDAMGAGNAVRCDGARTRVDFWLRQRISRPQQPGELQRDGRVLLDLTENNMEGHNRLQGKLKGMLNALDMHHHFLPRSLYLGKNIPIGGTAHQAGTIRFGTDPKSSALDLNCKAHELDNCMSLMRASSSLLAR